MALFIKSALARTLHLDIQSTRADITLCECAWVWCVVARRGLCEHVEEGGKREGGKGKENTFFLKTKPELGK